ncbi:MAG TPA: porin family protein [Rhizomicrobium sp.]|jgi:opacity protein-like surface antigen
MKTQYLALAGACLFALAQPASAGEGFYVGLGAGWDNQSNIRVDQLTPPPGSGEVSTKDGVIIAGTLGFKLPEWPIRLEFESGYDWHSVSTVQSGNQTFAGSGHANIASELFNAVYDFPVAPAFNLYGGAGLGVGHVWFAPNFADTGDNIAHTDHWGFMWQVLGGASFEIAPDVDLFADYRYRHVNANVESFSPTLGPVATHNITENVVMGGVRFYMFPPPPPPMAMEPAPAPYYPPPETPPPQPMPPSNPAPSGPTSGGATSGGGTSPQ